MGEICVLVQFTREELATLHGLASDLEARLRAEELAPEPLRRRAADLREKLYRALGRSYDAEAARG